MVRNKKKITKKKKHRLGRMLLRLVFLLLFLGAGTGIGLVVFVACNAPDVDTLDVTPSGFRTEILNDQGKTMRILAGEGANRVYVTLDRIPEDLQHAFVAIEDERFYKHNGIDMRGIIRAVFTGILSGGDSMQGASTITQQLLKNNYFTTWTSENTFLDSVNRKIQEQYLAIQLEKVTDKQTILENYLNTINLGQNTLGVEAASERYFNKSVSELTLSESATIAAITQNPSRYNPISNPDENATRRKKV